MPTKQSLRPVRSAPRWLLWALLALVSWGVWAILSKLIGEALTPAQSQALSTLGLLPVMAGLALSMNRSAGLRSRANSVLDRNAPGWRPGLQPSSWYQGTILESWRRSMNLKLGQTRPNSLLGSCRGPICALAAGVLGCLGNVAYYHALNVGGKAATVIPLTGLYPLVTVLLALVLLKERLNVVQVGGVALSLLAIYLFNAQSGQDFLTSGLVYVLIPIALWGLAGLLQKISTDQLPAEASTLWFLSAFVPVAAVILLWQPWPGPIAARVWTLVIALGLFFSLGNYGILAAFASEGKASVITPLSGLYPIVSVPIAILFLGERIGLRELAGISAALVSVIALSWEGKHQAT